MGRHFRAAGHDPHRDMIMLPIEIVQGNQPFLLQVRETFNIEKFQTEKRKGILDVEHGMNLQPGRQWTSGKFCQPQPTNLLPAKKFWKSFDWVLKNLWPKNFTKLPSPKKFTKLSSPNYKVWGSDCHTNVSGDPSLLNLIWRWKLMYMTPSVIWLLKYIIWCTPWTFHCK